jgi:hypothetical protein
MAREAEAPRELFALCGPLVFAFASDSNQIASALV